MFITIRLMFDRRAVALLLAVGFGAAGTFAESSQAPDFSADIVSRDAAGSAQGAAARVYVSNHKVRIETPEASAGFILIDGDAGTAYFVRPAQQLFMDAKQSSRFTQIFVPIDTNDPCRQWQAAAKNAGVPDAGGEWRCERVGAAHNNDRGTIEFNVIAPGQRTSELWIDPKLEFPVRLRATDGSTMSLEHIRLEAQPAGLFSIPPGFRKLDPQALIERIKHSDVWVEPQ
jgi:hypothetical protein